MKYQIKSILKKNLIYQYYIQYKNIKKFVVFSKADRQRVKFYQQFIKRDDLVFDVGANMGNRTKIFLKLNARVVAFEPQTYCSDFLSSVLKQEQDFTLVKKALGRKEGEAQMLIANAHTLSTLSESWSKITKESGRFSQYQWNEKQFVQITTLNNAIQKFGMPSFIKIDVEGYELEVLLGLSNSVDCISIEFASENIENTYRCIEYMNSLSDVSFQLAIGESIKFYFPRWVSQQELKHVLSDIVEQNELAWGDIYIRNLEHESNL